MAFECLFALLSLHSFCRKVVNLAVQISRADLEIQNGVFTCSTLKLHVYILSKQSTSLSQAKRTSHRPLRTRTRVDERICELIVVLFSSTSSAKVYRGLRSAAARAPAAAS